MNVCFIFIKIRQEREKRDLSLIPTGTKQFHGIGKNPRDR